jgi:hypothetical protein
VEGLRGGFGPEEWLGGTSKIGKGSCYVPEIADKLSIEVAEAQKAADFPKVLARV